MNKLLALLLLSMSACASYTGYMTEERLSSNWSRLDAKEKEEIQRISMIENKEERDATWNQYTVFRDNRRRAMFEHNSQMIKSDYNNNVASLQYNAAFIEGARQSLGAAANRTSRPEGTKVYIIEGK